MRLTSSQSAPLSYLFSICIYFSSANLCYGENWLSSFTPNAYSLDSCQIILQIQRCLNLLLWGGIKYQSWECSTLLGRDYNMNSLEFRRYEYLLISFCAYKLRSQLLHITQHLGFDFFIVYQLIQINLSAFHIAIIFIIFFAYLFYFKFACN